MATLYVRTDGNDSNDGSANDAAHAFLTVSHANAVATASDTIQVGAGTFALGNNVLNFAVNGLKLIGAGSTLTTITSTAQLGDKGCIVHPKGSGWQVSGLTIQGLLTLTSDNATYQAAFGFNTNIAAIQNPFGSGTISDVKLISGSDGIYLAVDAFVPIHATVTATGLEIDTVYDAIVVFSDQPTNDLVLDITSLSVTITGPNQSGQGIYRGIVNDAVGAVIRVRQSTVTVNGGPSSGAFQYTAAIYPASGNIDVSSSTLTARTTQGAVYSVYSGTGIATLSSVVENMTETFTSTTTWACPAGVTSVDVICRGGGGGGAGEDGQGVGCKAGGGGAVAKSTLVVVPATVYTVTVGAGGAGGDAINSTGTGANGGDSWFNLITTIKAKGGVAGVVGNVGGGGGSSGTSIGTTKLAGGAGGVGDAAGGGGGGGSSAGDALAGVAGSVGSGTTGGAGGVAPSGGGDGGAGGNSGVAGHDATQAGGGGGADGGVGTGGAGFAGLISLTYTVTVGTTPANRLSLSIGMGL